MKRSALLVPLFIVLFFGVGGFMRYSRTVRTVDAVGLFFSGAASGIAVIRVADALRARSKGPQLPV